MGRQARKRREKEKPLRPANRPRLETEERTIERLESLPPVGRLLGVHLYLVATFWPWWLTLLPLALILRFFVRVEALTWAAAVFAVLAFGGAFAKPLIERLAPVWAARADA